MVVLITEVMTDNPVRQQLESGTVGITQGGGGQKQNFFWGGGGGGGQKQKFRRGEGGGTYMSVSPKCHVKLGQAHVTI